MGLSQRTLERPSPRSNECSKAPFTPRSQLIRRYRRGFPSIQPTNTVALNYLRKLKSDALTSVGEPFYFSASSLLRISDVFCQVITLPKEKAEKKKRRTLERLNNHTETNQNPKRVCLTIDRIWFIHEPHCGNYPNTSLPIRHHETPPFCRKSLSIKMAF